MYKSSSFCTQNYVVGISWLCSLFYIEIGAISEGSRLSRQPTICFRSTGSSKHSSFDDGQPLPTDSMDTGPLPTTGEQSVFYIVTVPTVCFRSTGSSKHSSFDDGQPLPIDSMDTGPLLTTDEQSVIYIVTVPTLCFRLTGSSEHSSFVDGQPLLPNRVTSKDRLEVCII